MDESVACFWDLFNEKSKSYDIRFAALKWHVRYAEQYPGSIEFARSPSLGGLRVEVSLPL